MKYTLKSFFSTMLIIITMLPGCARDLSSNVYTEDSTLNLTLEGKIMAVRPVIVRNADKLTDHPTGMIAGGIGGLAAGNAVGKGTGHTAALAGGMLAGALLGTLIESSLSKADGIEYIVRVDTSKLGEGYYEGSALMRNAVSSAKTSGIITVVQGKDNVLSVGQNVFIILSPKRARVIPS